MWVSHLPEWSKLDAESVQGVRFYDYWSREVQEAFATVIVSGNKFRGLLEWQAPDGMPSENGTALIEFHPLPDTIGAAVLMKFRPVELESVATLSKREREVMLAVADGKDTHQIASELGITESTVHTHRKTIYAKTGTRNAAGIMRVALNAGWIEPSHDGLAPAETWFSFAGSDPTESWQKVNYPF